MGAIRAACVILGALRTQHRRHRRNRKMGVNKLNPAIMTNAEAAEYIGCTMDAIKDMKRGGRLRGVSLGATTKNTRYVTRESVERVLKGEV